MLLKGLNGKSYRFLHAVGLKHNGMNVTLSYRDKRQNTSPLPKFSKEIFARLFLKLLTIDLWFNRRWAFSVLKLNRYLFEVSYYVKNHTYYRDNYPFHKRLPLSQFCRCRQYTARTSLFVFQWLARKME